MTLIWRSVTAFIWVLCSLSPTQAEVILSAAEVAQTLRHGPWPPKVALEPSNRVSGDAKAISLGAALFTDPVLSRSHDELR